MTSEDAKPATVGKAKVTKERIGNEHATEAFAFKKVPGPVHGDAATKAKFSVVEGRRDRNGGDVTVLHNSRLPRDADTPLENFFFGAGTDGGRLLLDLERSVQIKQVNSYSWHRDIRGPQVYDLYASDGGGKDFTKDPKRGLDPAACGWERIASVDTRPEKAWPGGQYGVSISAAKGTIGTYRYLLFDMRRTESTTPFGNTFYSEIDVIEAKGEKVVPITSVQPRKQIIEVTDGIHQISIDVTETPDLAEWVRKELAPVVKEWYPKVVGMLPSEGFKAPRQVSITFSNSMRGVAATGGSRIRCAASWYRRNLKGEALGSVVHELVHVAQQYGRMRIRGRTPTRTPGWLVEGIADYIRWFLYEPETGGAKITRRTLSRARYDASYRISANFINWVAETQDKDIVKRLNAAARESRYAEDLWKKHTGKTLEELGDEWKSYLETKLGGDC